MAGGLGAALVGAFGGLGRGIVESEKKKAEIQRDAMLHKLQMEVLKSSQDFQSGQNALDRSQRATEFAANKDYQNKSIGLQEQQLAATKEYQNRSLEQAATLTREQIEASKTLQQMQIDAGKAPQLVNTDQGPQWMLSHGGKVTHVPAPINEETGKPYKPVGEKGDTPAITNFKFLVSQNVPVDQARDLAFDAGKGEKSFSDRVAEYSGKMLSNSLIPASPENAARIAEAAKVLATNDGGLQEKSAGEPAAATTTESTVPAEAPPRPEGASDEALIDQADAGVKAGTLQRQTVKQWLKDWGVDPKKAAAAGF